MLWIFFQHLRIVLRNGPSSAVNTCIIPNVISYNTRIVSSFLKFILNNVYICIYLWTTGIMILIIYHKTDILSSVRIYFFSLSCVSFSITCLYCVVFLTVFSQKCFLFFHIILWTWTCNGIFVFDSKCLFVSSKEFWLHSWIFLCIASMCPNQLFNEWSL